MSDIAEICKACKWQKDGKCYGFGRVPMRVLIHHHYDIVLDYPFCPVDNPCVIGSQNGMPCPMRAEREDTNGEDQER